VSRLGAASQAVEHAKPQKKKKEPNNRCQSGTKIDWGEVSRKSPQLCYSKLPKVEIAGEGGKSSERRLREGFRAFTGMKSNSTVEGAEKTGNIVGLPRGQNKNTNNTHQERKVAEIPIVMIRDGSSVEHS